ncbi:MAG: competence/damage-inducible protein A, partial [Elusimicrobia bacterium]|nr:competence/damage-inducible protein A [Elusimicrobiota bacterium]
LAVTGYAGPEGGESQKPGTGFIAVLIGDELEIIELAFTGDRREVKEKFAAAAMGHLWHKLKSIKP